MSYTFTKPSSNTIQQHLKHQSQVNFSYQDVGASRHPQTIPNKYTIDHNRIKLGEGKTVFEQAKIALKQWQMFNLGWVELCWSNAPIKVGTTVGVLAHVLGIWSLNCCRIVYLIDEDGPITRFGFAYGTLADHAERGEERFSLEWYQKDDSVWYDILAFSQPNQFLSKVGYWYVRYLQKQFAADSKQAMMRAVK